ncbi:ATP-binding protein [Corynebacterium sp. LK2510]|uniref:ATP-binding protein n=1 Tax=Corynebacterium sp. LK2510 TaxID=3110472 RepID=UPI0034CD09EE
MSVIPGQFRLSQIQVYNWGTFDNLHSVDVAREGFLITGPSGSGKSTLIDALSTILVPPGKVRFNAAADNHTQSGRNLVTYCRGAWRREHSLEADELTQSYLRQGATWSGVALRYDNGIGGVVTAIRLMFLSAKAHSRQEITDLYMLFARKADLAEFEPLALKSLPVTEAKKQYSTALHVSRSHPQFIAALRRTVGIADEGALDLLHRTQSAKTLGDLNFLMRSFMLPEPETFAIADQAVANFTDLHTAYASVVDTREQIEHLLPVRVASEKRSDVASALLGVNEERENLELFVNVWRQRFAQKQREQLSSDIAAIDDTISAETARRDKAAAELDHLRTLIHGAQDSGLVAAESRRDSAREQLTRVEQAELGYSERLAVLGAALPSTVTEFTNLRLQLVEELDDVRRRLEDNDAKLDKAQGRVYALVGAKKKRTDELQALRASGSTMDSRLIHARSLIAEVAGVKEKDLPFVADLMSMKEGEERWQGAAERVLGGFARTLIVPEELYPHVSSAINVTHLGAKVAYTRLSPQLESQRPSAFTRGSLGQKIEVAPGRFRNWIESQLCARYDHMCCETMEEFHAARRAVTAQGQVKRNPNDHIKDDRSRIDDKSRWVLWGNLDDKIDQLHAAIRLLNDQLGEESRTRDRLKQALDTQRLHVSTIQRLLEMKDFAEIDVAAAAVRLAEAQKLVDDLTDGNTELAELKKQLAASEAARRAAENTLDDLRETRGGLNTELKQAEVAFELARQQVGEREVPGDIDKRLEERCHTIDRSIRADNIDRLAHRLTRDVEDRLAELRQRSSRYDSQLRDAMNRYLMRWPQRQGDLTADTAWENDFLNELGRLESDDLPRFEQRFRDMLHDQTYKHLGRLRRFIRDAATKTRNSIQMINDSLAEVEFYPGTHLTIEVREAQPAVAREFVELLDAAMEGMINDADQEQSEQRFHKLRAVIDAVTVSDTTTPRQRRMRLDTREHVKFLGVEYGQDGVRGAVYDSAEGLSGGQAQKLSSFCLAAALRYRLTGMGATPSQARNSVIQIDGEIYPRFGTIILDEAFDRADTDFTRAAMEAFRSFGFHMILATPEKLLQTVQDYIGGVLMVECPDRKRSRTSLLTIEESTDEDA